MIAARVMRIMCATITRVSVMAGSIEAFESISPLIVWRKEYRTDSGGAGKYRGGLGQECEIENRSDTPLQLSLLSDRWYHPAVGVLGGS